MKRRKMALTAARYSSKDFLGSGREGKTARIYERGSPSSYSTATDPLFIVLRKRGSSTKDPIHMVSHRLYTLGAQRYSR